MPLQEILKPLWTSLLQIVSLIFNPVILIPAIIAIIVFIKKIKVYKSCAYYQITKLPYFSVIYDTGRLGEYLTYKYLKRFETTGAKFLFNVYVPKENGETSEIDVLMISSKGIFVFESKNYSGWIFGSETQKNWYQTLPQGKGRSHKEHFYNPIMQNRSHIKHLKEFLGEQVPMRSIIVFSERCTLKNVQTHSDDINVIKRDSVLSVVSSICGQIQNDLLTENDIAEIYNKLYPYTQVDETVKMQHIANIHNNTAPVSVQEDDIPSEQIVSKNQSETTELKDTPVVGTNVNEETNEIPVAECTTPEETNTTEQQRLKCPNCNGDLILRTATRGANAGNQFYGCSNYPKCKYVQNIVKETTEKQ